MTPPTENWLEQACYNLQRAEAKINFSPQVEETGHVTSVTTGVARVRGLPGVGSQELVHFTGNLDGITFDIDEQEIGVVLLDNYQHLMTGSEVRRSGRVIDIAVGEELLGRVINPRGHVLDNGVALITKRRLPIERPAPAIMDRAPVTVPLQTGIKVIDALIPIGRGQRQLILGDRQIGKTAIAIDTIINQRDKNVRCIYCAIGQRSAAVARVIAELRKHDALQHTVIMVSEANDPPGLAYIAPYAATSIAEAFMEQGDDVLIVYDDLTHHARAYRELCLLLRRPPGREAFPGDIFYLHSRLLERSTQLGQDRGGGSLTALPIVETQAQNMSAYIPTNLISITDGQIYLAPTLFELGILPAVDVGRSVSRVGGKAQNKAYREVTGHLKLDYAQFEELEGFSRFGTRLDEQTRRTIAHGQRIRSCLQQPQYRPLPLHEQLAVLWALEQGLFAEIPFDHMALAQQALLKILSEGHDRLIKQLLMGKTIAEEELTALKNQLQQVLPDSGGQHE